MPHITANELFTVRTDLYKARTALRAIKAKLEGRNDDPDLEGWPGIGPTEGPHATIMKIITDTLPKEKPG